MEERNDVQRTRRGIDGIALLRGNASPRRSAAGQRCAREPGYAVVRRAGDGGGHRRAWSGHACTWLWRAASRPGREVQHISLRAVSPLADLSFDYPDLDFRPARK